MAQTIGNTTFLLASQAEHEGSIPFTCSKTKGNCFRSCLSFWVPAAGGGLHPAAFQCSGSAKPPLRNSRPQAGNLRATRRAAQKGRCVVLLLTGQKLKVSILTALSKKKDTLTACLSFWVVSRQGLYLFSARNKTKGHPYICPFVLGSAGQGPAPPLVFQCSGLAKPPHLRAKCRPAAGPPAAAAALVRNSDSDRRSGSAWCWPRRCRRRAWPR